jgi:hypothetical protein
MASRTSLIRTAIETHVGNAISGITITNEPMGFDPMPPKDQFPHAVVLFREEDPERLDFKQERRRVRGEIRIAVLTTPGDTAEATRETVDGYMTTIRDDIFGDETLGNTVDDVSCEGAEVFSGQEDTLVYGVIEVTTEEVF